MPVEFSGIQNEAMNFRLILAIERSYDCNSFTAGLPIYAETFYISLPEDSFHDGSSEQTFDSSLTDPS